jgi:hypothetical protein
VSDLAAAIAYLRTPLAVRARCETILEAGLAGSLAHFEIDLAALPAIAAKVVAVTRDRYPDLRIPAHGRTTQFRAGGIDRAAAFEARLAALPPEERARAWIDLIVVSVAFGAGDGGAGDAWRYREPETGAVVGRSEGLAVASLRAFETGLFSSDPARPLQADAAGLRAIDPARLIDAFQAAPANPLAGLDGRIALVHDLGAALAAAPQVFPGGRPGGLYDHLRAGTGSVGSHELLGALLEGLAPIWPGRIALDGTNLGDVGRHPAAGGSGPSDGLVPFHRLAQWLAYSLFEPLERAGIAIAQPGALTGLADDRNGGLLVDLEALVPRHDRVRGAVHEPGDEVIVEWRALTVALLDRLAEHVREQLGKTPAELPLACILEGGTAAAGRVVAAALRPTGAPPIRIH